jgi:Protein of unknown function (DUF3618)
MTTSTRHTHHNGPQTYESRIGEGDHSASSREIERDIARTRHEMDETLHELGERLHPKHLVDHALDLFRSSDTASATRSEYADRARKIGKQALRQMKEHPIPTLLCGAGLAWLAYEELARDEEAERWRNLDRYSEPHADVIAGGPYTGPTGTEWRGAAWSEDYDWSLADEDEQTWTNRATRTLDEVKTSLSSASLSAREKLRTVGGKLLSLSGRKRQDVHAQWASLREHSGSFVDARTGQPYDESYGREFRNLLACDYCATGEWSPEDEHTWSEKASHAIEEMKSSLSTAGTSVKDRVRGMACKVGDFVGSTRDMSADYSSRMGHHMAQMGRQMRDRTSHAWDRTRRGSARLSRQAGQQIKQGATYSRDQFARAVDDYPLAVGAAFLGLGLIAGLALPHTRVEDEWMGEASDDLKERAKETGEEIVERGRHVAEATISAAAEEVERQGLTPEQIGHKAEELVSKVEHVAERAVDEAQHETERETSNL